MRIRKNYFFIIPLLLFVMQLHGQSLQQLAVRDTTGYLILANSAMTEPTERLAEWKKTLGFKTDIMYVNSSLQSDSIENLLGNYYSQHPYTKYLAILGGDGFVKSKSASIYLNLADYDGFYHNKTYTHPTDFYYGNLDNDSVPQVHRGRLLANDAAEANTVVDKIITYESTPIAADNIYNNGIHVSYYQEGNITMGGKTHERYRFVRTSEEIKEALLPIGRTVKRIYDIPASAAYWNNNYYCSDTASISAMLGDAPFVTPNAIMIQDSLRAGASYILYTDHGSESGWSNPSFDKYSFPANLNKKWPVYFNCCCETGLFSSSNCFAKDILTNLDGGIASISASDISLEGFMSSLFEGIFDGIWPNQGLEPVLGELIWNVGEPTHTQTPIYRLGDLLDYGLAFMKAQMRNAYAGDSSGRPLHHINDFISMNKYMHEIYHLFGDPALEIRTQTPEAVSAPSICQFTDNTLLVKPTDGYSRVVLYDLANNDVQTFYGTKVLYNINTDSLLKLCVVRSNTIPYIKEYSQNQIDMFIQNEAIDGIHNFVGNEIKVGTNVTEDKLHGDVYFNTRSSTSLSGKKVKLSKGVIITHGSSVRINKNS